MGTFWQACPLPGRNDRLVATFAPLHGFPHGAIGLIDRRAGPEGARDEGFVYVTHEFPDIGDCSHQWSCRDPVPLSDRRFLCAYGGGGVERYRIYLLDADDQKRLIHFSGDNTGEWNDIKCERQVFVVGLDRSPESPNACRVKLADDRSSQPRADFYHRRWTNGPRFVRDWKPIRHCDSPPGLDSARDANPWLTSRLVVC